MTETLSSSQWCQTTIGDVMRGCPWCVMLLWLLIMRII